MKKLIGMVALVTVLLFAVSCSSGVSQEKYDKATSDLTAKTAELQSVNTQYTQAKSSLDAANLKIDKATSDLTAKTAELQSANTQYTQAKSSLDAANVKLNKAKIEITVVNAIFLPAMTGELNQMSQADQTKLMQTMEDNIKSIGDAALQAKWDAMKNSGGDEDATMAFFQYLLSDVAKTLQ